MLAWTADTHHTAALYCPPPASRVAGAAHPVCTHRHTRLGRRSTVTCSATWWVLSSYTEHRAASLPQHLRSHARRPPRGLHAQRLGACQISTARGHAAIFSWSLACRTVRCSRVAQRACASQQRARMKTTRAVPQPPFRLRFRPFLGLPRPRVAAVRTRTEPWTAHPHG